MTKTAQAGLAATRRGDTPTLLAALDAYTDLTAQLGDTSGADILCAEHRRIRTLAREAGVVYKPCGAGGGDVGMAFSDNMAQINHLSEILEREGFIIVHLCEDKVGLQVET
jgi:phosphomevalonate kinase